MPKLTDTFHKKKLKEYGINIKTIYLVDRERKIRNTDDSYNDDIINGIRLEKDYYVYNNLKHVEKNFDTRIEYSFISKESENNEFKCPNCGMKSILKSFEDGCPYCRTYYNIDYTDKALDNKNHYDRVLINNRYRITVGVIDYIISFAICYYGIVLTSRTFNIYDVSKIFIYAFILALILYYFFYLLDAYIILAPIKNYKDKQNKRQIEFWNNTKFNKKEFFNNLNYEVRKYYYSKMDIIDYDVIDYLEFSNYKKDNKDYVDVKAYVRIVYYINNKIKSKYKYETYTMVKNDKGTIEIKDGINYIKCHNCGASIKATEAECSYCHHEIKYLQEWILINK